MADGIGGGGGGFRAENTAVPSWTKNIQEALHVNCTRTMRLRFRQWNRRDLLVVQEIYTEGPA